MHLLVAGPNASAVFGLVGTLVGALIAGGTTVWLARARRRDEVRATARLVEEELRANAALFKYWKIEERLSAGDSEKLETAAWNDGRSVLAHGLTRANWERVRTAYAAIDKARRDLDTKHRLEDYDAPIQAVADGQSALDLDDSGWVRTRTSVGRAPGRLRALAARLVPRRSLAQRFTARRPRGRFGR